MEVTKIAMFLRLKNETHRALFLQNNTHRATYRAVVYQAEVSDHQSCVYSPIKATYRAAVVYQAEVSDHQSCVYSAMSALITQLHGI